MRRNQDTALGRSSIDADQMAVKCALRTARYDAYRTELPCLLQSTTPQYFLGRLRVTRITTLSAIRSDR